MSKEKNIANNELVIYSSTDNLSEVREFIAAAWISYGYDNKEGMKVALSVDEACTNIIKHAYHNKANGIIKIKVENKKDKFIIKITDKGSHFDPNQVPEPNIPERQKNKRGGGLGMFLMKKLMDEVKYMNKGRTNELILVKHLN
ncbi:MAG: ATP-binding protein [Bacteroidota bacterium]